MSSDANPRANRLLASLPDAEWLRWQPHLEPVELRLGNVIYESKGSLSHVYFPTTAIVSLLYVTEQGASAEIAVVGSRHRSCAQAAAGGTDPIRPRPDDHAKGLLSGLTGNGQSRP